jgi:hypothetical protein
VDTTEILVAFGSSVAGAAVGAALPLFLPDRSTKHKPEDAPVSNNTITGGRFEGTVHVGNDEFRLTNDNRVIINGPAIQNVTHLAPTRERVIERTTGRESDEDNTWGILIAWLAAVAIVIIGYLRFRDTVTVTVLSLSGFAMFLPLGALAVARRRSVSFGRTQTIQVWVNVILVLVSLLGIYLLSHPLLGIDRSQFTALLEAGRKASLRELFERFGFDWALFLMYQLAGLAISVLSVTAIAFHSLKLYAISAAAVRAAENPEYRATGLRGWLVRAGGSPGRIFTMAFVLAVLSILLISGAGYALISKLQTNVEIPGPSVPTPGGPPSPASPVVPGPKPPAPVT